MVEKSQNGARERSSDSLLVGEIVSVEKEQPVRARRADRSIARGCCVDLTKGRQNGDIRMSPLQHLGGEVRLPVYRDDDLLHRVRLTFYAGDRLEYQVGRAVRGDDKTD